jgi:hypothetical protein
MLKNANTANGTKAVPPAPENGKKVETTVNLVPIKKEEEPKPAPSVPGRVLSDLPPVEDRILKVSQLFSLVEKHDTLLEAKKKLKAFKLSTDGSRDSLRIQDGKGNEFYTTNSGCIADVLEVLKVSIDRKIAEVEAQIKF